MMSHSILETLSLILEILNNPEEISDIFTRAGVLLELGDLILQVSTFLMSLI
jgi:hypothetical protein